MCVYGNIFIQFFENAMVIRLWQRLLGVPYTNFWHVCNKNRGGGGGTPSPPWLRPWSLKDNSRYPIILAIYNKSTLLCSWYTHTLYSCSIYLECRVVKFNLRKTAVLLRDKQSLWAMCTCRLWYKSVLYR